MHCRRSEHPGASQFVHNFVNKLHRPEMWKIEQCASVPIHLFSTQRIVVNLEMIFYIFCCPIWTHYRMKIKERSYILHVCIRICMYTCVCVCVLMHSW
jgi:hypothetical protein